jgi:hypothetical protein
VSGRDRPVVYEYIVEMINTYRILVGEPEGKRSLERPMCRQHNDSTVKLEEIAGDSVYWIQLHKDRVQCE